MLRRLRARPAVIGLGILAMLAATPVSTPSPNSRAANSIVMDVDLEGPAASNPDYDIIGTLQLLLNRIAAYTAPRNRFGQPREIIWLTVNNDKECQHPTDTGILQVTFARSTYYNRQWVVIGRQSEEADLAFKILDCDGRVIFSYPNTGDVYGSARFSPYYLSISGSAAAIAVSTAHANNLSIAAVISIINGYGPLQNNIGEHDPTAAHDLALFRLIGNIPGKNVPPPAPGTVSSLLEQCRFVGIPGGSVYFTCPARLQ
jgi:hypothetical protein